MLEWGLIAQRSIWGGSTKSDYVLKEISVSWASPSEEWEKGGIEKDSVNKLIRRAGK